MQSGGRWNQIVVGGALRQRPMVMRPQLLELVLKWNNELGLGHWWWRALVSGNYFVVPLPNGIWLSLITAVEGGR